MKMYSIQALKVCLVFGLTGLAGQSASAQERVGDFALLDDQGYFHHMSWYDDHQAIVLLVQAALPGFANLADQFSGQGLQFFLLNAMGRHNRDAVHAEMQRAGVAIPVLMDDAQLVAETLGVERTAEVLVYDPESFTVTYRGSGWPAAGRRAERLLPTAPRLPPRVSAPQARPSTTQPNSPISSPCPPMPRSLPQSLPKTVRAVTARAALPRSPWTAIPWSQGWSPMIREVLMTKRMPPGQIDPHVGEFSNDMRAGRLPMPRRWLHWIDAGAPHDGGSDPLAALTWPQSAMGVR